MPAPRILILRAPGTNCNEETAFAFERAGGQSKQLHVNRWLETPSLADDFQVLCIPGGFSYGDDVAAGRILANQLHHHLADALRQFQQNDKLILGICNGFQALLKTGLLAPADDRGPVARNPWGSLTLEWEAESPPVEHNFAHEPVMTHGPYDYDTTIPPHCDPADYPLPDQDEVARVHGHHS